MRKPLILGFKRLPHAEKMAAKRKHAIELAQMLYDSPGRETRIQVTVARMQEMNARNGVGRPPFYKRFLVAREAA